MTLKGHYALSFKRRASFGAHHENLNEDRPILSATSLDSGNCGVMIDIYFNTTNSERAQTSKDSGCAMCYNVRCIGSVLLCVMQKVIANKMLTYLAANNLLKNFGGDTSNRNRSVIAAISCGTFFIYRRNRGLFPVSRDVRHRQ